MSVRLRLCNCNYAGQYTTGPQFQKIREIFLSFQPLVKHVGFHSRLLKVVRMAGIIPLWLPEAKVQLVSLPDYGPS